LTFNELERKFNIPFVACNDIKSAKSIAYFQSLELDLVLSVRFGKIFGEQFIALPSQGILNLHSGLLPNYRGVLASFRALQHGDKNLTATLHWIDSATIDTGKIIGFSSVVIQPEKSVLSHILSLYPASLPLTLRTIQQIIEGKKSQIPSLPNEGGAYFSFPSAEEIQDLIQSGWKMTDMQEMKAFYEQYY
jgi:methionyl-tRNA formyltransferase